MRGTERIEALADAARERGMDRFALTDTNALYGFVFYRQICEEWGLTPIAGAEVVEVGLHPAKAVLLAKGREGYRSLCHVLTARHLDPTFTLERAVRANAATGADVFIGVSGGVVPEESAGIAHPTSSEADKVKPREVNELQDVGNHWRKIKLYKRLRHSTTTVPDTFDSASG
jgi:DNA polymerase III alpha subunit